MKYLTLKVGPAQCPQYGEGYTGGLLVVKLPCKLFGSPSTSSDALIRGLKL